MSRFNEKSNTIYVTKNYEGDVAYKHTPEMELYMTVCTSLMQPTFYVPDTNDQLNRIKALIKKCDDVFVAQLAVYVREQMYLRSVPMVLTVELAKQHSGDDLIRRLTRRVIQRADEITELLAYYTKANKKNQVQAGDSHSVKSLRKLSNQMKKGIKDVFESGKFDEYQLSKYSKNGQDIKIKDALFLTHPKPTSDEMKELFQKLANDELDTAFTWETQLSQGDGKKTVEDKKVVWEKMIDSGKMGYMAILRNLRNFITTGVSKEHLYKVAEILTDPKNVRKSKQLPFRFLSAYRSININNGAWNCHYYGNNIENFQTVRVDETRMLLRALEKAVKVSIENVPLFDNETVLIASDVSSSMFKPISDRSTINNYDIGLLMSMILRDKCRKCVAGVFGSSWAALNGLPKDNILDAVHGLYSIEGKVGYATNGHLVLDWACKSDMSFDRVFMFTDEQMWNSDSPYRRNNGSMINKLWKKYKSMNPQSKLYIFNLNNYGQSAFDMGADDVYHISGWSDKIFDILKNMEKGGKALDEIKKIEL